MESLSRRNSKLLCSLNSQRRSMPFYSPPCLQTGRKQGGGVKRLNLFEILQIYSKYLTKCSPCGAYLRSVENKEGLKRHGSPLIVFFISASRSPFAVTIFFQSARIWHTVNKSCPNLDLYVKKCPNLAPHVTKSVTPRQKIPESGTEPSRDSKIWHRARVDTIKNYEYNY